MTKKLNVSFSALETFKTCPRKYYYNYVLKLPRKEWPWLIFGTFVHLVLEKFHTYVIFHQKRNIYFKFGYLMKRAFQSALRVTRRKKIPINNKQIEDAKRILKRYLDKIKTSCPNTIYTEKWFEIPVGDLLLRGSIDRVDDLGDGKYDIVDYKTSKSAYPVLKNHQLSVYAYALKTIFKDKNIKQINKKLDFLKVGRIEEELDTEDHTEDAINFVKKTGKEILEARNKFKEEEEWKWKENDFCWCCDFKERCYASRTDIFEDPKPKKEQFKEPFDLFQEINDF